MTGSNEGDNVFSSVHYRTKRIYTSGTVKNEETWEQTEEKDKQSTQWAGAAGRPTFEASYEYTVQVSAD